MANETNKVYNVIHVGSMREGVVGEVEAANEEEALEIAEQQFADPDSKDAGFGNFRVEAKN